jgi:hypothetical protein
MDMFPNGRLAGDTFVFFVNRALNPLSMSPIDITITSFSSILSETAEKVFYKGLIDSGTT